MENLFIQSLQNKFQSILPGIKKGAKEWIEIGKYLPEAMGETIREGKLLSFLPQKVQDPIRKAVEFIEPKGDDAYSRLIRKTKVDPIGAMGGVKNIAKESASKLARASSKFLKAEIKAAAFPIFKGFNDLTTKILNKLTGRSTVSKQFISDLTNAPDLKQAERNVIRNVLDSYIGSPASTKYTLPREMNALKIQAQGYNTPWEFEKAIMQFEKPSAAVEKGMRAPEFRKTFGKDLGTFWRYAKKGELPEGQVSVLTQKSKDIPVDEFANKVKQELLPLKINKDYTSETGKGYLNKWENTAVLPDELRGNVANYSEHVWESPIRTSAGGQHFSSEAAPNYFGHTRVEDLAGQSKGIIAKRTPPQVPDLGTVSVKGNLTGERFKYGQTRRVIELQSDLYQKGALAQEGEILSSTVKELAQKEGWTVATRKQYNNLIIKEGKRGTELKKLQQYNDPTAHFRMVREEVKQAAVDGKIKLQFPTGNTAMKIEGLGEYAGNERGFYTIVKGQAIPMKVERLKIGLEMNDAGANKWRITEVLGEGRFKAMTKEHYQRLGTKEQFLKKNKDVGLWNSYNEQFDISGKVDINDPIYKFYEKDLGKYITNKYGAKQITDPQGVTWYEFNITPEMGKAPVEAFSALPFLTQKDEDKQPLFINK